MSNSKKNVIDAVQGLLWPLYTTERERLGRVDLWYRWQHEDIQLPRTATPELRALVALAKTPWLGLVVSVMSQTMFVDGYRSNDEKANSSAWRRWLLNRMESRQLAIHRATLAYGYAFGTATAGVAANGDPAAVLRGYSPLDMQAVYGDPAEDDWPMWAMRVIPQPGDKKLLRVFDEENVHFLSADGTGSSVEYIEARRHGAAVTPVVRYANQLDLQGRTPGEVEPFIPIAARINKTDFDRLVTQHFSSWKVRYMTGMAKPDTQEEANAAKLKLSQDSILVAESPDSRFGTLDATPLDGFLKAHDQDVETLAAVTQTPTPALTGKLVNLNAEALAAVRAQLDQKVSEKKVSVGDSHAALLRLGASIEGNEAEAFDVESRITWQDTSIRSLQAAADGLGKLATMLHIPVQALWGMVPGVTKSDVKEWEALAAQGDPIAALNGFLDRQAAGALSGPQTPATPPGP